MSTKQIFGLTMAAILVAFSGTAGAVVYVNPGAIGSTTAQVGKTHTPA